MKLLIVFLFFCGAMAQNQGEKSLGRWQTFSNKSYVFPFAPQTWADAQMKCQEIGGHLAVINSKEEEDFVMGLTGGNRTWIGLSLALETGSWFWTNSDPVSYTNWCNRQPDNKGGQQHCTVAHHLEERCWDDVDCDLHRQYVCERSYLPETLCSQYKHTQTQNSN